MTETKLNTLSSLLDMVPPPPSLKILLIGDSGVGKSSLLLQYSEEIFEEKKEPTIGVDFKVKIIKVDGNSVKLTLWDTAGQERFRTLTSSYYRGAQGIILVYDVTKPETLIHLEEWYQEVLTFADKKESIKMIIGNKIDLKTKEEEDDDGDHNGKEFARKNGMMFLQCSAKLNVNVQNAFEELVRKILEIPDLYRRTHYNLKEGGNIINLNTSQPSLEEQKSSTCIC